MSRKLLLIVGAVSIGIIAVVAFVFLRGKSNEVSYKTEKAARGDVVETVTASGTVNAVTTVLVGTQVSGTIKNLYVDYNSKVKKGQLLAQIDPVLLEAQVEQARANLLKLEANTLDARRTRDRNKQLFERNLIARSDYETAEANYDAFVAQVNAAKASLRSAQANLQYTRILSPVDGIVISRAVDVGQTVAASFQTPTLFTIAQDLTKMQVDTTVNEADIGRVKEGQEAEFTVDAYPNATFKGTVFQVRNAPVTVQNVVTYTVVIQVDNKDLRLKPGMTANASITTAMKKDVLRVQNAALRVRIADKSASSQQKGAAPRGPGVWVLENKTPKRVKVALGISDGTMTEVTGGDLKEGMDVIVSVQGGAQAGSSSSSSPGAQPPRGPRMF
ncbi:MAG: efflux RND transporter periplasmic adaptor subunit [Nitrospiraceae bacterium]|jgi:HlyD family secretion protein|nr:efflux RND transporter periplasmic adaptor subunit [Nitrospiraceae bacterium]